ncbi:MAG TPA: DUF3332 family protein [Leptospiraceae bacterium]|nr:DUF3332 family protein [Leptospiraceae bacterium]HMW08231.1 DUF3332 family protein [Leptospiraceae bacterium]HMX35458.1 DUF3332 family protein [Leptospiraceae bacterium]HMY29668.1 DUF3332 family protein [Leptospiraceae bacterium]HMZ66165.1 DUF3332 family protein [Leptospiraceae bacterium]
MSLRIRTITIALLISILPLTMNCFGKFALTRKAYQFNETLGGEGWFWKFTRTFIAYIYFLFPVYVVLFSDALVFNLIEFWTDNNLIGYNEYDKNGIYVKYYQKEKESLTLTYLNFGKRLNLEVSDGVVSEKFVVYRNEPGVLYRENKGKIQKVDVQTKDIGSKRIIKILNEGKLETSIVKEKEDFQKLEKKYLGEFY